MHEKNDAQLIHEAVEGGPEAFDELVRRYQDRVYNLLFRLCSHEQDAEDLTQEVFIKVFHSLGDFRSQSSFYTWLYRITANSFYSHCRKQRSRKVIRTVPLQVSVTASDEERVSAIPASPQPDPQDIVQSHETVEIIQEAIDSLPEEHRMVAILKDVDGLEYQEIAEILDWPIGTVKSRLHRVRKELVEKLKDILDLDKER